MPTVGERASDKLTPYRGWFYAPHNHEPICLIAAASCARIPPGGDGQATEDADIVKPRNGGPARCIFAGPRRRAASAFRWVLAASNGAFAGRGTVLFGVVHLCVHHAGHYSFVSSREFPSDPFSYPSHTRNDLCAIVKWAHQAMQHTA